MLKTNVKCIPTKCKPTFGPTYILLSTYFLIKGVIYLQLVWQINVT